MHHPVVIEINFNHFRQVSVYKIMYITFAIAIVKQKSSNYMIFYVHRMTSICITYIYIALFATSAESKKKEKNRQKKYT